MSIVPLSKQKFVYAPDGLAYTMYSYQYGVKTTMPDRVKPQPYLLQRGEVLRWQTYQGSSYYNPQNPSTRSAHETRFMPFGSGHQAARNKAYDRFKDAVFGSEAAIGTAIAESRESFGMIANRSIGLYRAYRSLRKGDFRGCLRQLSVSPKRKHRNIVRTGAEEASGLWLEYWFGWSPMLNDIYTATQQLSEPLPDGSRYRGRSSSRATTVTPWQRVEYDVRIETGARVRLVNPNLALAAQLGLVNPASVAWDIIPFSFLVDWCFDVSSFIGSYTDFVGCELSDVYTSETARCVWTIGPFGPILGDYVAKQVFMERRLELIRPLPNNGVLSNLGTSITRAASAVSLLVQILGGKN